VNPDRRGGTQLLVRYAVSGGLGTLGGYALYEVAYALVGEGGFRATTAWIVAYTVGIFTQHALHRWITFGTGTPYWRSLRRSYIVYPLVLAISSGFNYLLAGMVGWHHRLAWLATMALSAGLAFAGLRFFAFAGDQPSFDDASRRTT